MSTSPRAKVRAPTAPLPEPAFSRVRGLSLIRREVREILAPRALDLLWGRREEVIEGGRELGRRRSPTPTYFASVMVTIDLQRCRGLFREPADVVTAERVAELMRGDRAVHERLVALVLPELAALSGRPPAELEISLEFRVRAENTQILIDGDAMTSPPPGPP
ncbi:MAG: hypothetical protein H6711_04600 [Myxococcales bacterium]|nr:hypothetical protein [Myxococcales bacterium]